MSLTTEQIVDKICCLLFTNGADQTAKRLVLELEDGRDGGGWCRSAVRDIIATQLATLNGKPKRSLNYTLIENAKDLLALDELMDCTSQDRTLTTAEIDGLLRQRGLVVMSISTRLSHLRRNYEAASQGTIKKREERRDGKRIVHYWRAKV